MLRVKLLTYYKRTTTKRKVYQVLRLASDTKDRGYFLKDTRYMRCRYKPIRIFKQRTTIFKKFDLDFYVCKVISRINRVERKETYYV